MIVHVIQLTEYMLCRVLYGSRHGTDGDIESDARFLLFSHASNTRLIGKKEPDLEWQVASGKLAGTFSTLVTSSVFSAPSPIMMNVETLSPFTTVRTMNEPWQRSAVYSIPSPHSRLGVEVQRKSLSLHRVAR